MSEVVSFAAFKEEAQPHWHGMVQCLSCKHEWEGVAPMGVLWLDCPECGLPQGHPRHPFGARDGDLVLVCTDCDGEALTAFQREGCMHVMCMGCGSDLTEAFYE